MQNIETSIFHVNNNSLDMVFIIRIHLVDFCDKSCIYDILTLLKNEEIKG